MTTTPQIKEPRQRRSPEAFERIVDTGRPPGGDGVRPRHAQRTCSAVWPAVLPFIVWRLERQVGTPLDDRTAVAVEADIESPVPLFA
jgi:hypothetical protein